MSASSELSIVQRWYTAFAAGDQTELRATGADDLVWDITPNFPAGGVYRSFDAIFTDFLPAVSRLYESMSVEIDRFYPDGDGHVVAQGRYLITAKNGATGESRFAHFLTVRDGKIVRMEHVGDALAMDRLREE